MNNIKINKIGDYIDIEIPKGKSRKEMKEIVERVAKDLQKAGIVFEKLTEEDRKIGRAIAKEKGWEVIEDE